jgi:hypothetical protein
MEPNDELIEPSTEETPEEISPEDSEKVTGGGIAYGTELTGYL